MQLIYVAYEDTLGESIVPCSKEYSHAGGYDL
jgi:hypothetical protein